MSRYWLDWFAKNAMEIENRHLIGNGKNPYASPAECIRVLVGQAYIIVNDPDLSVRQAMNEDYLYLVDKLAPFSGADLELARPPLAVAVADTPDYNVYAYDHEIEERAKEVINTHSRIYLDLADHVFMMPGNVFQVRALFITGGVKHVHFSAILTRPGTNKGWLFAWLEGHHNRHPTNILYDDVWAPDLWMIADASRPINRKKIDYSAFADLERLASMTIANWSTLKQHAAPALPNFDRHPAAANNGPLPTEAMAEYVAHGDRIGEMPMADSIFNVVALPALGEARIRQIRNRISGIKYQDRQRKNCAHTVDGFWRMQAYGPDRKLRKRVWIDGFKRGSGPAKPVMNSLPREYRAA
ncbi:hypothetical protein F9K94_21815 [Brucella tritici]|uniref:Uncharacterized protein n=1 Tax=Brucella tritici TaxID=94626 RepID=A0A7V8B0Y8_9HYPH|nr:hypothetical protein [Brucella tritici]KAB2655192.1 hypothetical protein F9K94_21815 [Brucella tritici]